MIRTYYSIFLTILIFLTLLPNTWAQDPEQMDKTQFHELMKQGEVLENQEWTMTRPDHQPLQTDFQKAGFIAQQSAARYEQARVIMERHWDWPEATIPDRQKLLDKIKTMRDRAADDQAVFLYRERFGVP